MRHPSTRPVTHTSGPASAQGSAHPPGSAPPVGSTSGGPPAVRLTASSMTDLVQLVPYLLGFHPSDSVVAVLLRRRRVLLTARVDLGSVAGLADQIAQITTRHRATGVVLAAYTDSPVVALAALEVLVGDHRLPRVVDAVHVDAGRWWSLQQGGDPDGHPLEAGHLAAEAVYAGLTAASDRSRVVAAAATPTAERLAELAGPLARQLAVVADWDPPRRRVEARRLVTPWLTGPNDPAPTERVDDLIRLGLLLGDVAARDDVILLLDPAHAEALVRCWTAVVAVLPDEHAMAAVCLLGLSAWVAGHGALLVACVERVERCAPDYSLGHLLAQVADQAVPPSAWSSLGRPGEPS